jgi:hypothetical protein
MPLNYRSLLHFDGGADGIGFAGPFHPEVTSIRDMFIILYVYSQ